MIGLIRQNPCPKFRNAHVSKGYRGYVEFTEFLRLGEERMKLVYEAEDSAFCFVDVKSLAKTELVAGALTCLIIFQKLSPWLKSQVFTIEVNEEASGKVYPFIYPYRYPHPMKARSASPTGASVRRPFH
jgi:hypothetical protein